MNEKSYYNAVGDFRRLFGFFACIFLIITPIVKLYSEGYDFGFLFLTFIGLPIIFLTPIVVIIDAIKTFFFDELTSHTKRARVYYMLILSACWLGCFMFY